MNVLEWIAARIAEIVGWVAGFWQSAGNVLLDVAALAYGELLDLALTVIGTIGIPSALTNFHWPSAGPVGPLLRALGLPEAVAILAACWTVRLALKFTVIFG